MQHVNSKGCLCTRPYFVSGYLYPYYKDSSPTLSSHPLSERERICWDRSIGRLSIALEIGRSEFGRIPIYGSPEIAAAERPEMSSSSSSSIGKNSESWRSDGEDSSGEKEEEEEEVESAYKGSTCALNSLEEALPIRRGISSCYQGKSKSFSSLSDAVASCNSASDFAKPENAYTRRRRNDVAKKMCFFKSPSNQLRIGGGISKRFPTSRSTLALAVAMNNSKGIDEQEPQQQHRLLPPLHPGGRNSDGDSPVALSPPEYCSFSTRSFSLTDLEGMAASSSSVGLKNSRSRFY